MHPAERDGSLWTADARGGLVHIRPDGSQRLITASGKCERRARPTSSTGRFRTASPRAHGDILIANFGTDALEVDEPRRRVPHALRRHRRQAAGQGQLLLRDSKDRLWITISTRINPWPDAIRNHQADGYIALIDNNGIRIVADGFYFTTRSVSMPARNGSMPRRPARAVSRACA